jgi:hypothetical protein
MKNILMLLVIFSSSAHAAFDMTNTRYLSGTEVIEKLNLAFPAGVKYATARNYAQCSISSTDQSAAGLNSPATGRSIYLEPGTAFFNWYKSCVDQSVANELNEITPEIAQTHLGPLYSPTLDLKTRLDLFTDAELMSVISYNMKRLLGPDEVIQEFGYMTDCNQFRQELLKKGRPYSYLQDFLKIIEIELVSRDEFLSY